MAGYTQEEYEESQDTTPVDPPKGTQEWADQNSGQNAPELQPSENPAKGTLEAHEQQQANQNPPTSTVTPATTAGVEENKDPDVSVDPNAGKPQQQPQPQPTGPTQEEKDAATAGYDSQIATLNKAMEQYAPETPEERKKREKREKAMKIVAAISDGIQAVSNLWFTSQYAPNAYNHDKQSQLKAETTRLDKLKAERDANADKYYNYAMKAGDAANGRAKTLRELEAQHEAQRLARAEAARKEEAQGWARALQLDKVREQAGKADKAAADASAAQVAADGAQDMQDAKLATEKARAGSYNAAAANSRASAAAHGRANQAEFIAYDENGKEHPFHSQAAAEAYARQHGTWQEEEVEETSSTTTTGRNAGTSNTTKKKKIGRSVKPATDDNTPPSRR